MISPLRRVVVTGIGAVSPLGGNFPKTWQRLVNHESGITTLEQALQCQGLTPNALAQELALARDLPCQVAAPVGPASDLALEQVEYPADTRMNRSVQLALQAAAEAIKHAQLSTWFGTNHDNNETSSVHETIGYQLRRQRAGVSMGNGMSSVRGVVEGVETVQSAGLRRVRPYYIPKLLANMISGHVSLEFKLQGPNLCAATACAASSHAIGEAMRCIQFNQCDIMLAGGSEGAIDPHSLNGFCRLRALSTASYDTPAQASRPFDTQRDGFVMGEGAAVLVLEEYEHAVARGAPILAELAGYGLSGDAYHITSPDPVGGGAGRAMTMALQQAGVAESSVDYVNAHATSTPVGDEIEARVIQRILMQGGGYKDHATTAARERKLYVSSTKGATGHMLGAAGAMEAAFCIQAMVDGRIPPTLNLQTPDVQVEFEHVVQTLNNVDDMQVVVSNSFGFGGTNASLLFKRV